MRIRNLTPESVTLSKENGGYLRIAAEAITAVAKVRSRDKGTEAGVAVSRKEPTRVINLPEMEHGTVLIVTCDVARDFGRSDLRTVVSSEGTLRKGYGN